MKLEITEYGKTKECSIADYVYEQLDGDDYGSGELKAARRTADNAIEALGNILECLADKEILTADDIVNVVGNSNPYIKVEFKNS